MRCELNADKDLRKFNHSSKVSWKNKQGNWKVTIQNYQFHHPNLPQLLIQNYQFHPELCTVVILANCFTLLLSAFLGRWSGTVRRFGWYPFLIGLKWWNLVRQKTWSWSMLTVLFEPRSGFELRRRGWNLPRVKIRLVTWWISFVFWMILVDVAQPHLNHQIWTMWMPPRYESLDELNLILIEDWIIWRWCWTAAETAATLLRHCHYDMRPSDFYETTRLCKGNPTRNHMFHFYDSSNSRGCPSYQKYTVYCL